MQQENPKITLIVGAGESGTGAARLAKAKGLPVFLTEKGNINPSYKEKLQAYQIDFEENKHDKAFQLLQQKQVSQIVKSPGIPDNAPLIQEALQQQIPIISEIEFASRYTQAKIIAITGSNGKTTTTLLTHHLLKHAGLNVAMGGNVGNSFAELVIDDKHQWYVLEVSSFQLDGCYEFKPFIAILLNITPDHLDRYEYDFEKYADAKFRITQAQDEKDYFVYHPDNPAIERGILEREKYAYSKTSDSSIITKGATQKKGIKSRFIPIEYKKPEETIIDPSKVRLIGGFCTLNDEQRTLTAMVRHLFLEQSYDQMPLKGRHNLVNIGAAVSAGLIAGINEKTLIEGLQTFQNIAHRLELVAKINEVQFINDSKATNVDAVWYALDAFDEGDKNQKNIIWIAGGQDKGNDYQQIQTLVKRKVKKLICLGIDNQKLKQFFSPLLPEIAETQSISEAIDLAIQSTQPGDVVLLSPACASFDLFKNYEDRGNQFKTQVQLRNL
ncbi:MAG: UDP-N-acetylmuramoyl-L-alanine--D-glutamate ligase [Cytophagales bacterium]|nr:MAG: UDP-N-acetylmuramoyl-L-alanine--D-glutamate ligase [Cytophagales bacterium]